MRAELPGGKHLEEEWRLFTRAHHMLCMLLQPSATDEFKMIWQPSSCPVHNEALWVQQFLTVLNNFRDTQAAFRRRRTVSEYNHNNVVIICLQTQNSSKPLTYKEMCLCVSKPNTKHTYACVFWPLPWSPVHGVHLCTWTMLQMGSVQTVFSKYETENLTSSCGLWPCPFFRCPWPQNLGTGEFYMLQM